MYWPLTLVGLLAGFTLASIPGALLGGLLGQVLDRRLGLRGWTSLLQRVQPQSFADLSLLFVMLGRLAKSGGVVTPAHIQQARLEMQRLGLDEGGQKLAIESFSRGKAGAGDLRKALARYRRDSAALLLACWRMAWADGQVTQSERELILLWGKWLGVSFERQQQFCAACAPSTSPSVGDDYQQALRLLDVRADSEPQQIKRAYRRLLSQHHPDKLAGSGAPEQRVREATEMTQALHEAYTLIRQRHGFR
jgi:DnaJ like chaperone protein